MLPHRKKLRRYENPGELRFLTFSCYGRLPLFKNDRIKAAFVEEIAITQIAFSFGLIAWVIMPEHVHLLIFPHLPEYPVSTLLKRLRGNFANRVLRQWRELEAPILPRLHDSAGKEHFWQRGGGYDRNVYTEVEIQEKFDYIHNNPVNRKLAARAIDWRWSSARWYECGKDEFGLNMAP
jgi:putative transposase